MKKKGMYWLVGCMSVSSSLYAQGAAATLNSQIQAQLKQMQSIQNQQITNLNQQLQTQLAQSQSLLQGQIERLNKQIQQQLQDLNKGVQQEMQELRKECVLTKKTETQ
jgi:TolA-binding protein